MTIKNFTMAITISVILSGCTWVKTTPEGEKVRVLSMDEVSSCKNLGKIYTSLKDKVAGVERNKEKVKKEMETLARNQAGMGEGDTIVPITEITDGKQTFQVYRCVGQ